MKNDIDKTKKELLREIEDLRSRLSEEQETLRAISRGEVDAFVISGAEGEQLFTLKGAEHSYRVLVETMNEGAATLAADGTILYCNTRLAALLQIPLEKIIGTMFDSYVADADKLLITARFSKRTPDCDRHEVLLITGKGNAVPVLISCCPLDLVEDQGMSVVITDLTQQKQNEEFFASERLARSIIDQAGEAIIVCDEGGMIIQASAIAHELCGENPLLKQFDEVFFLRIQKKSRRFHVADPLQGRRYDNIEVTYKNGVHQVSTLLLNATPLTDSQNRIIGCIVTLNDITDRKRAEEKQRASEKKYHLLFDKLIDGFALHRIVVDEAGQPVDYTFLEVNRAFENLTGLQAENILNRRVTEVLPGIEGDTTNWISIYGKVALTGEELRFDQYSEFLGKYFSVLAYSPQRNYFATVFQDITASKQAQSLLMQSEERYRLLAKTMLQGIVHQDANGNIISMNPAAEQILGKSREQFLGSSSVQVERDCIRENGEIFPGQEHPAMEALRTGLPICNVIMGVYNPKLDECRWISIDAVPVIHADEIYPAEVYTVFSDITERKRAEEQIKASLAEKEVLLKEIHHRVKNNLQVISSLVSLQADNLTDERIRKELNDVCGRVRSMALIHEKLYETGDLAHLNFADYATNLLQYLWNSYDVLSQNVRLNLALAPMMMTIETAVPCGLILNELASNTFKHAFPNNRDGEVIVSLDNALPDNSACLRVRDNGIGLPEGLDWQQTSSLGLRLVQILVGQLRGTVEAVTGPGTEFKVTIPLTGFQA